MTRSRKDADVGNPAKNVLGQIIEANSQAHERVNADRQLEREDRQAERAALLEQNARLIELVAEAQKSEAARETLASLLRSEQEKVVRLESDIQQAGPQYLAGLMSEFDQDPLNPSNPLGGYLNAKIDLAIEGYAQGIREGTLPPAGPLVQAIEQRYGALEAQRDQAVALRDTYLSRIHELTGMKRWLGRENRALKRRIAAPQSTAGHVDTVDGAVPQVSEPVETDGQRWMRRFRGEDSDYVAPELLMPSAPEVDRSFDSQSLPVLPPVPQVNPRDWQQKKAVAAYRKANPVEAVRRIRNSASSLDDLGMSVLYARSLWHAQEFDRAAEVYALMLPLFQSAAVPYVKSDVPYVVIGNQPELGNRQGAVLPPVLAATFARVADDRESAYRWLAESHEARGDMTAARLYANRLVEYWPSEVNDRVRDRIILNE